MISEQEKESISFQIQSARKKLLDLSMRNSLLNFKHSEKAQNQMRFVNTSLDFVFKSLLDGKDFQIHPLEQPPFEQKDEDTASFENAFALAQETDEDYLKQLKELEESPDTSERTKKQELLERELKNKVRKTLNLSINTTPELSKEDWAEKNHINPLYDIPKDTKEGGLILQTLLYPKELKKRVLALSRLIKSDKEEKGTNTFYMAFGFLQWRENDASTQNNNIHDAPLLLIQLDALKDDKKGKITLSDAGNGVQMNFSLMKKLEEMNIQLPLFSAEDTPSSYFEKLKPILKEHPTWEIKHYLTIGRFIFSRLSMYEDLDTQKNWPHLFEKIERYPFLSRLFCGKNLADPTTVYDIDLDSDVEKNAPFLITDADSSQHSAVVDALKGESMILQGPPGAGKSQTITNLIANALYQGKKVLFVSEKKAALDVVYQRLKKAQLEDFCLELHSDKTSLKNIKNDLAVSFQKYCMGGNYLFDETESVFKEEYNLLTDLKNQRLSLRSYYESLKEPIGAQNMSLFEIIWRLEKLRATTTGLGDEFYNLHFPEIDTLSQENLISLQTLLRQIESLEKEKKGDIVFHFTDSKQEETFFNNLAFLTKELFSHLEGLKQKLLSLDLNTPRTLKDIDSLSEILQNKNTLVLDFNLLKEAQESSAREILLSIKQKLEDILTLQNAFNHISYSPIIQKHHTIIEKSYQEAQPVLDKFHLKDTDSLHTYLDKAGSVSLFLKQNAPLCQKIITTFTTTSTISDKEALLFTLKIAKLLQKNTPQIASFIQKGFEAIKQKDLFCRLATDMAQIFNQEDVIKEKFKIDYSLLNNISFLETAIALFENRTPFSALNSDFRKARAFYNETALHPDESKAGADFRELSHYYKLIRTLLINQEYRQAFPEMLSQDFNKVKTQFLAYMFAWDIADHINKNALITFGAPGVFSLSDELWSTLLLEAQSVNATALNDIIGYISDNFEDQQKPNTFIEEVSALQDLAKYTSSLSQENISFSEMRDILTQNELLKNKITDVENLILKTQTLTKENIFLPQTYKTLSFIESLSGNAIFNTGVPTELFSDNALSYLEKLHAALETDIQSFKKVSECVHSLDTAFSFKDETTPSLLNTPCEKIENVISLLKENQPQAHAYAVETQLLEQAKSTLADPLVTYLATNNYGFSHIADLFLYIYYSYLLNKNEQLKSLNAQTLKQTQDKLSDFNKQALLKAQEHIRKTLGYSIDKNRHTIEGINAPKVSEKTDLSLIYHQITTNARPLPLRTFLLRAGEALQTLKPCFLMSPISVAQYITPERMMFDMLIIDEASQMYFEEALGSLLRARQFIVVGDNKQLPPTPFFQKTSFESDEEDAEETTLTQADTSVLETALSRGFKQRELLWHYRSKNPALIQFSNKYFYKSMLNVFPAPYNPQAKTPQETGITNYYVQGLCINRQNETEADMIATQVLDFIRTYPDRSLGIATMNISQQHLIEQKTDILRNTYPEVAEYMDKWETKLEGFFVKNLENVQGDERDYIFVSTVYGPQEINGKVPQHFGPINGKNGGRRLNVLFSRARYGLKLFTSLKPTDIVIKEDANEGLKVFRAYLEYAQTGLLGDMFQQSASTPNIFEEVILNILSDAGYKAEKRIGMKGFFVDIAVQDSQNPDKYILGIECDPLTGATQKSVRDKDYTRPSVLKSLGWNIYRIWSKDWFNNPEYEKKKLLETLENISTRKEI